MFLHIVSHNIGNRLLDSIRSGERKNIGAIYDELSIYENPNFDGDMDYFSKLMKHFENNLK